MDTIRIKSTLDGSIEESLVYIPATETPIPLVVSLHTWSADRFNQVDATLPFCKSRGWACVFPEFRGPNLTSNPRAPDACGSELAKQDIIDAVDHIISNYRIDESNVFLVGGSGGGHMSLLMAAYAPRLWRGVSSWCPITDLTKWYSENSAYSDGIAGCCGGPPGSSEAVIREYIYRSPISHVGKMAESNLYVHHGRFDSSVPRSHTQNLVEALEKLNPQNFFYEIFDGSHELRLDRAFSWFDSLYTANAASALSG